MEKKELANVEGVGECCGWSTSVLATHEERSYEGLCLSCIFFAFLPMEMLIEKWLGSWEEKLSC